MKAALLFKFDESLTNTPWLDYRDVPDPVIEKPNDVIVRIGGAGVCGTDLQLIQGHWRDYMRIELPLILGHENAGWVEDVGTGVESVNIGDPVLVYPLGAINGEMASALGANRREERAFFPGFNRSGGFAEYMLAKDWMLLRLPSQLSPMDAAPLSDAGLTAYNVTRRASKHLAPGHHTLILGAGGLGHIAIQILRALSATEIIAVDISQAALNLARKVGAHYTFPADEHYPDKIRAITRGMGVETVIDFVGSDITVRQGISITRRGGYYYVVGCGGRLSISTLELVRSEKTIVGIFGGSFSELNDLVTMVDRGLVSLTIQEYSLSNADEALQDLKNGRKSGRLVLIP